VTGGNPRKTAKNRQSREAAKENVKDERMPAGDRFALTVQFRSNNIGIIAPDFEAWAPIGTAWSSDGRVHSLREGGACSRRQS
jgi:hypothetical protein